MPKHDSSPARQAAGAGVAALLSGFVYYFFFRPIGADIAGYWPALESLRIALHDPSHGSFPSFIHTFIFTLLAIALFASARRQALSLAGVCLVMTVAGEFFLGTFDPLDLLAALLGFLLPIACYSRLIPDRPAVISTSHRFGISLLVAGSGLFIMGTSPNCEDGSSSSACRSFRSATPVYISLEELRNSVSFQGPRDVQVVGKVYLYQQYLFLNERNAGIHVFNNADKSNPVNLGFIVVPGNTEINIADNYLYADSYIDLLTLDLNDPTNVQLIAREEGVFPFDAYQNIPSGIEFNVRDIDESRGVIVSYVE